MFEDVLAIGQEHGVNKLTAVAVVGLQILAMLDGCQSAEEGFAWAVERGYVLDPEGKGLSPDSKFSVTEAGLAAVAAFEGPDSE